MIVLAGCGSESKNAVAPKSLPPPGDMDSPITVSDGSTHLRHPVIQVADDIDEDDGKHYTHGEINDSGFVGVSLECTSGCSAGKGPYPLGSNWKIEFADNSNKKLAKTREMASATVKTHFYGNPIQPSSGTTGEVVEGSDDLLKIYKASITKGTSEGQTLTCDLAPGTKCEMKVHYCNNSGTNTLPGCQ
jgi:hypothetical protein